MCWLLLLVFLLSKSTAQESRTWSAYLLTDQLALIHIFSDGTTESIDMGLPDSYQTDYQFQPSPSGDQLAFCARVNGQAVHVLIYDTNSRSITFEQALDDALWCSPAFNEDAKQLAVTVNRGYAADMQDIANWEIRVFALASGEITARVRASDAAWGNKPNLSWPELRLFRDGRVYFGVFALDSGSGSSYVWSMAEGTIEPSGLGREFDFLPATGEFLWTALDESLARFHTGTLGERNVIRVADASGDGRVILHSPDRLLLGIARFIDDGRKIAVHFYQDGHTWLFIFDRYGQQVRLPDEQPDETVSIFPTPTGFITVHRDEQGQQAVIDYRFAGDELQRSVIWQAEPHRQIRILGATPLQGADHLPPLQNLSTIRLDSTLVP